MASSLPPSAVPLKKAFSLFASPDRVAEERRLKEERQRYPARIRYRSRYLHGSKVDLDNQRAHRADQLEQALQANGKAAAKDLLDQLRDGRLVGYARASAFDEWKCVPPDAWDDLKVDFRKSSAEGQDGKVCSVRIDKPLPVGDEAAPKRRADQDGTAQLQQANTKAHDPVEIAFDHERPEVVVSGVCVLTRGNYEFLKALYELTYLKEERAKYVSAYDIAGHLGSDEETVRGWVKACRNRLAKACPERFDDPSQRQLMIETSTEGQSGYRFHPTVQFIPLGHVIRVTTQRKRR